MQSCSVDISVPTPVDLLFMNKTHQVWGWIVLDLGILIFVLIIHIAKHFGFASLAHQR